MRRPAIRFLLTLVAAASILGAVPATSEAGIIPWAWDTMFGPVGSIQARRTARFCGTNDCGVPYGANYGGYASGSYYGPAPRLFGGLRGWRNTACCNNYGSNYGYVDSGCGCSTCGSACGSNCSSGGCSSCGTGYGGYDGGYVYGSSSCGAGGCASGQCNVNYGPNGAPPTTGGASPVTPAPPPAGGAGGPTPSYDNNTPANKGAGQGAATDDGFVPAQGNKKSPAPPMGDPNKDEEYKPPIVNPPAGTGGAAGTNPTDTTPPVPAPEPTTPAKKRPNTIGDDDDKSTRVGPRFDLHEKVTWRQASGLTRQIQAPVRVTATANRNGLFPKIAWRSGVETNLAKK